MAKPGDLVAEYLQKENERIQKAIKEASQVNLTPTGLSGMLWFSEKQWRVLRNQGRDRTYGELADGRIVEYTEMISLDMLKENPDDVCGYEDAKFVGVGKFHHWEVYRH